MPANDLQGVYVTGLRDAHALENQALAMIDRQLERLVRYPEMAERLRLHRDETGQQIIRLQTILAELDEEPSMLKDAALSLTGNMAALSNSVAGDEVLKNSFANLAMENYEIASYTSLITMAEVVGAPGGIPLLRETLAEERAMAAWVHDHIEHTTRRYLELRAAGEKADR